ncbi:DUF2812 domain-containing protein [uncultured Flavonifractor sp.]|uniref:DUF2812 domain-containing protein n=1 Tax=uncultured Flavonifractor sp. TaxID=1193534 RepID=UPI00262DF821|nr:DUF2812 domain-containing protein [uncultured Flavonifractor sp.]
MKRKWTVFAYPVMDIKAAEAMLNRRAAEGWRLEKMWLDLLAAFVPAEEPVCYCLDWYDPNREDGLDYRTLLADAGWRQVGQLSYWNLYEAPAGTAPIQTDGELEYRRFRKKALRRMTIGWGTTGGILAVLALLLGVAAAWKPGALDWRFLATFFTDTNTGAMLFLLLPLLLPGGVLWSGRLLLRLGQWKRAIAREESFPVPGPGSTLAARLCTLAGNLLLIPLVLAFLLDTMAKEVNLGWIIGTAIGCLIVLGRDPMLMEYQRKRRYAKGTLVCVAVLLVLRLLPLSGVAGLVCVRPPLADGRLLPERTDVERLETHATLLSARTEWYEVGTMTEGGFAYGYAESEAWALPWDWLADWVTEQYRKELGTANQKEVPGYENVWLERYGISGGNYPEGAAGDVWLIRRGSVVLWVETNMGPLDGQWLDGILARLEEDGA